MTLDLKTMQRVSEYVQARRSAKVGGRGSIAFGLLAVVGGGVGLGENLLAIPLLAIGVFLVSVGVWVLKSPTAESMRLESIALWIVAAWNILLGLLSVAFSSGEAVIWVVIGAWQVYWGIQAKRRSQSFRAFSTDAANSAALDELERMVNDIQSAPTVQSKDVIEFDTASLTTRQHWKGKLGDGWALFVDSRGTDVVIAAPTEVSLAKHGETVVRHNIKADIALAARRLKAKIPPESFERFSGWKATAAQ